MVSHLNEGDVADTVNTTIAGDGSLTPRRRPATS
jgi:hypothetical protein